MNLKNDNYFKDMLIVLILSVTISTSFTVSKYSHTVNELKEENFQQQGEIQELKQTIHMIQMMNEGKKYIDEI